MSEVQESPPDGLNTGTCWMYTLLNDIYLLSNCRNMSEMSSMKEKVAAQCSINNNSDKKRCREVQVMTCPSDFPQRPHGSAASHASAHPGQGEWWNPFEWHEKKQKMFFDWNEIAREVRILGSQAFLGKEMREHWQEEYMWLTGCKEKQQRVLLPIQRGIRNKAAKWLETQHEEAWQAGIILPRVKRKNKVWRKIRDQLLWLDRWKEECFMSREVWISQVHVNAMGLSCD